MPGKTIGTHFNPAPELLWQANVTITRVGTENKIEYQYQQGDAAIDRIVRQHFADLVKSFGPSGPGKEQ